MNWNRQRYQYSKWNMQQQQPCFLCLSHPPQHLGGHYQSDERQAQSTSRLFNQTSFFLLQLLLYKHYVVYVAPNEEERPTKPDWSEPAKKFLSHKEEEKQQQQQQEETSIDFLLLSQCHHIVFVLTAPTNILQRTPFVRLLRTTPNEQLSSKKKCV